MGSLASSHPDSFVIFDPPFTAPGLLSHASLRTPQVPCVSVSGAPELVSDREVPIPHIQCSLLPML
jgi:hypothetical protein